MLKQAIILSLIISCLQLLSQINSFSIILIEYNVTISYSSFIIQKIIQITITTMNYFIFFTISIAVAEGLTKQAFKKQIIFWQVFSVEISSSKLIWKQVFIGFLLVGFHLLYAIIILTIGKKYFGWWFPSNMIFNSNTVNNYQFWLPAVANSIQAGSIEECLFRAIPIASAGIIGDKFGKKKYFIISALLLQSIIFGGIHANYPVYPGYVRIIELIIPSLIFGCLYISYGLLPGIITHIIYDLILMSYPIFILTKNKTFISKLIIILIAISPIIYIVNQRLRHKKWHKIQYNNINESLIEIKK